jgi:hypothetical protein
MDSKAEGTVVIKVPGVIARFDIGSEFDPPAPTPADAVPLKEKGKKRKK